MQRTGAESTNAWDTAVPYPSAFRSPLLDKLQCTDRTLVAYTSVWCFILELKEFKDFLANYYEPARLLVASKHLFKGGYRFLSTFREWARVWWEIEQLERDREEERQRAIMEDVIADDPHFDDRETHWTLPSYTVPSHST